MYVESNGVKLFTIILLPNNKDKFPCVVVRMPYVDSMVNMSEETVGYTYNPFDPPTFKGGLSRAFGGGVFQDGPNSRHDIISIYTQPFEHDTQVKGKM